MRSKWFPGINAKPDMARAARKALLAAPVGERCAALPAKATFPCPLRPMNRGFRVAVRPAIRRGLLNWTGATRCARRIALVCRSPHIANYEVTSTTSVSAARAQSLAYFAI